jgi:hypothetical protein
MANAHKLDWAYKWAKKWIQRYEPKFDTSFLDEMNLAQLLRKASRRNEHIMFRKRRKGVNRD